MRLKDLTGQRFGKLTVIRFHDVTGAHHSRWWCRCDCGNEKAIERQNLMRRPNPSCGCLVIPGIKKAQTKHGATKTKLYTVWTSMLGRCRNPNDKSYSAYGGRGIDVCQRWHDFGAFREDMGAHFVPGFSIERLNVNGNYEPSNCTWIPLADQFKNRRPSSEWNAVGRKNPAGLRGVTPTRGGRWTAQITLTHNGTHTRKYLGTFDTKEEAAEAFRAAAQER